MGRLILGQLIIKDYSYFYSGLLFPGINCTLLALDCKTNITLIFLYNRGRIETK